MPVGRLQDGFEGIARLHEVIADYSDGVRGSELTARHALVLASCAELSVSTAERPGCAMVLTVGLLQVKSLKS